MGLEQLSEQILIVTELRGNYPGLPLPDDIDMDGLAEDLGFRPKPVTLRIGKIDAESRNKRIYREQAWRDIANIINSDRLDGAWGHMRDADRPYVYVQPAIRWVHAELINDELWALGIPLDSDTDKYFRAARRMNAKVGTSVYGAGDVQGRDVVGFKGIEKIDIADPMRVGIPDTAVVPQISEQLGDDDMLDITLPDVPEAIRQQIIEQFANQQNGERVTEMETRISELQSQVTTLTTERDAARGEASKLLVSYAQTQIAEKVKHEPVQKLVSRMVGIREQGDEVTLEGVSTVAEIDAAITAALEDESIKAFNKDTLAEMLGPGVKPPADDKSKNKTIIGEPPPY